ncbi:cysteine hydrolase family protein [Saccharopolyspora sp. 5N708]|uniref:cysteine hydrolase family protein n=1 Tax=Saccharopolyspora sp. 5N708 TaxID=3457424 RepID=UPI003FD1F476
MDTALLVIDMQNGFCHPDGSLPRAGTVLPGVAEAVRESAGLIQECRRERIPVIYTRHVWRADFIDAPPKAVAMLNLADRPLVRGTWDADVVDELRPQDDEIVLDKNRFDAFLYTDLEVVLRALGVRRLLVCGVVTSICVESTVRSAQQRDFEVIVASDCTAAPAGQHEPSLAVMAYLFATVAPWRQVMSELRGAASVDWKELGTALAETPPATAFNARWE